MRKTSELAIQIVMVKQNGVKSFPVHIFDKYLLRYTLVIAGAMTQYELVKMADNSAFPYFPELVIIDYKILVLHRTIS